MKRVRINLNLKGQKMRVQTTRLSSVIATSLLVLAAAAAVHAEDSSGDSSYVKDGWYLGLQAVDNSMSGEFDNSRFFTSTLAEVFDVPDVDDGTGFGVLLGLKSERVALEFGYQRSSHDTTSSFVDIGKGGKSEASYNVIDLNLKVDVFTRDKLRPHILFGIGIPWLTIDGSLYDGISDSYEDETFRGFAFNAGAGVAYYLRPQWALTGGLIYRWNRFSSVEGKNLDNALSEKAFGLTFGIMYTF